MRSYTIPTSKAKLKLLDSVELLVSQKGFDAVSVRDVTQLAKANVASVNYHFGSRDGMMALMISRRMSPIHEEQLKGLNLLEKKRGNKSLPLEELLNALLGPLFMKEHPKSGSKPEVMRQCVARILALSVDALPQPLQESGSLVWSNYLKALGKCLKELGREELVWRLHMVTGTAMQTLVGTDPIEAWVGKMPGDQELESRFSRLLRLASAMMRAGGMIGSQIEDKPKGPQGTFDF